MEVKGCSCRRKASRSAVSSFPLISAGCLYVSVRQDDLVAVILNPEVHDMGSTSDIDLRAHRKAIEFPSLHCR